MDREHFQDAVQFEQIKITEELFEVYKELLEAEHTKFDKEFPRSEFAKFDDTKKQQFKERMDHKLVLDQGVIAIKTLLELCDRVKSLAVIAKSGKEIIGFAIVGIKFDEGKNKWFSPTSFIGVRSALY